MPFVKTLIITAAILLPACATAASHAVSAHCEEALALSALPDRLRSQASVYVLGDGTFKKSRESDGPFTCIVARTHERALIPQCADAAGADTIVPGIILKSLAAIEGATPEEQQRRFDQAVARGDLRPPARPGVSYMVSAFNYNWNRAQGEHTLIPPHVMYYAPNLDDRDVGGSVEEGMGTNPGMPFIIEGGIHGYMVSMVEHASDPADVLSACGDELPFTPALDEVDRVGAAIQSSSRKDDDRLLDESRKPREFLQFLNLREGDRVVDINAGTGYNARLLTTMVGQSGRVYATNSAFIRELFDGINERLAESTGAAANVSVSTHADDRLDVPEPVDVAILNLIYHDLHWQKVDTARFNKSVFDAIRPGGTFVVADHSAVKGSGASQAGTVHRIERSTVVREIEAAGFELVEMADFLTNPDDNRELFIVDPAIRGRTDRFLLKFRRP